MRMREERRGEWNRYYPYVMLILIILVGGSAALSTYVRETTGSWVSYLISPVAAEILVVFIIVNRRKFDGRPLYDPSSDSDKNGENRCLWCDTLCTGECCSHGCERLYRRFEYRLDRYARIFIVLLVPITILAAAGYFGNILLGAGLLVLGYSALLITLPEVIAGTAIRSPIKAAMGVSRMMGFILLAFSCLILIYALPF